MRLKLLLFAFAVIGPALAGCASVERQDNLTGDFLAGRFAERSNSVNDAAAAYARAHERSPQQPDLLRDAFFYQLAAGNVDAATGYARELVAIGQSEHDGLARITLAAQALKQNRPRQARALLAAMSDARFLNSVAFLIDVWTEDALLGPEAALAKLENPGADIFSGFNALHKALLSEQAGRFDDARAAYEASALALGEPVGRVGLGVYLERRGETADARSYYKLLSGQPGPMRRASEQGFARLDKGEASPLYARATPSEGAAYAIYAFAGALIQQTAGERMRAEQAGFELGAPRLNYPLALARLALYLKPDFPEARRLIATILNIYGETDAAIAMLEGISPSSPHFEQARIEIASGLMAKGEEKEAQRVLVDAMKRDGEAYELRWTLATIYAAAGKHQRAVKTLDKMIKGLPVKPEKDAWRYFVSRAASLIELDRWPAAEQDLKRAAEIAPEEPSALNYLGYSWIERGIHLEEAFEMIEKAVALQPDSGPIIDSLGWAHYQLGQYEEAVAHLEKAAALEPADPTITEHLGDVYWRLGRKIEARYQWRRSLELEPDEDTAKKIREKVEGGLPAVEATGERGEE